MFVGSNPIPDTSINSRNNNTIPYFKDSLDFFEENSINLQNMLKSISSFEGYFKIDFKKFDSNLLLYFMLQSSTLKFNDENTILGSESFDQSLVYNDYDNFEKNFINQKILCNSMSDSNNELISFMMDKAYEEYFKFCEKQVEEYKLRFEPRVVNPNQDIKEIIREEIRNSLGKILFKLL